MEVVNKIDNSDFLHRGIQDGDLIVCEGTNDVLMICQVGPDEFKIICMQAGNRLVDQVLTRFNSKIDALKLIQDTCVFRHEKCYYVPSNKVKATFERIE